jgi:hypothetical protein
MGLFLLLILPLPYTLRRKVFTYDSLPCSLSSRLT